jgi:hypothetical protein
MASVSGANVDDSDNNADDGGEDEFEGEEFVRFDADVQMMQRNKRRKLRLVKKEFKFSVFNHVSSNQQKHADDAEKFDKLLTASTSADAANAQQKEAERLVRLAEQRRVEVIDLSSGDDEEDVQPSTSEF